MGQVLGAGALGRPRGIRWKEWWEGESGWGIHVNPWLIHFNVWQKPLQYFEVISLQLIKINEKKQTEIRPLNKQLSNNVYLKRTYPGSDLMFQYTLIYSLIRDIWFFILSFIHWS